MNNKNNLPTSPDFSEDGKKRQGMWIFFRDILVIFAIALLVSFLIKTFLIRSFFIPSSSYD